MKHVFGCKAVFRIVSIYYFRKVLIDQRWSSCCTLSDGKHDIIIDCSMPLYDKSIATIPISVGIEFDTIPFDQKRIGTMNMSILSCARVSFVTGDFFFRECFDWSMLKLVLHIVGWQAQ